jgi:4-aminobutyrate aminotransferase-like enzyme
VRVAPSLVIDEEQAEYALRILGECIADVQRS